MPTLCTQMVTRFVTNVTTAQAVMAQHPTTLTKCPMSNSRVKLPDWFTRKISEKTAELFKTYKDGQILRHYYYDVDGKLTGAKVRTKNKDFRCEGEVKTLFGMQNFPTQDDKANHQACHRRRGNGCDERLGVTTKLGCRLYSKWCTCCKESYQKHNEWVNYYDKIVIFFDNDDAGRRTLQKSALGCYHLARFTPAF